MKQIAAKVVLLMTFVFGLTVAGYSQQPLLKADVPFDFTVGKMTFPAGQYQVIRIAPQTLTLRGENNRALATFVTQPGQVLSPYDNPKLKFKVVGGQHMLAEIWPNSTSNAFELLST